MENEAKALPVVLKDVFGLPGETFADFKAQYAKLTEKDRSDLREWLIADGYKVK